VVVYGPSATTSHRGFHLQGLGIVQDGEEVMELTMKEFVHQFEGQIPNDIMQALHELFKVGSMEDDAVNDALLAHSDAAGLELGEDDAVTVPDAIVLLFLSEVCRRVA
jgi:hypothetical protein